MKFIRLWTLGWLFLLSLSQLARAQQIVPLQADGGVSLVPVVGADGGLLQAGPTGIHELNARGTVAGRATSNAGDIEIGFDYLRPYWTSRDFTLAVPTANVGSFPLLGDVGHVDDHFAMVPHLKYKYNVTDLDFSINASGTFLNLTGHLDREVTNGAATGNLTSNSSLTIVTANLPEVSTRLYYDELFTKHSHLYCSMLDDLVIDVGVGTRYSSIDQSYTGSLTNSAAAGVNQSTRYSHQSFKGIGLTTTLNFSLPVKQDWVFFTNLRGSFLVGDNDKDSTMTVTVAGVPGISNAINQSRTEFIPIAEVELGTQWGWDLGEHLHDNAPHPLCTVRLAVAGQFWGGVGPLSAGSSQGFATSNLFLVGAHIMVGIHR